MDPMMAMMNGLPQMAPPPPPPGPPMGPGGLPVGGSMPELDPNFSPEMGGSPLLQALRGSVGGGMYDAGPEGHAELGGMGTGDPSMGLEQLIQMIALANGGVGGGVPPGGSGVAFDRGNPGIMF
jgi:hypothetical protein